MELFSAFFAHEGGWDEILLVSAPIVVIIALLAVAKKRVENAAESESGDSVGHSVGSDDVGADGA